MKVMNSNTEYILHEQEFIPRVGSKPVTVFYYLEQTPNISPYTMKLLHTL